MTVKKRRRSVSDGSPEVCSAQECGRPRYARGLCQTHYRQLKTSGRITAIRRYRPRVSGTLKYAGLRLSTECVRELKRRARRQGLTPGAAVASVLEEWHAEHQREAPPPAQPDPTPGSG